jgi:plastocyanin
MAFAQSVSQESGAAAKAAERKRKFQEAARKLENGQSGPTAPEPDPNQTLFVSPATVTMGVGDSHSFCAFDIEGKTVTSTAEWSVSDSEVAQLAGERDPTITAKQLGTVTVRARIGSQYAEASVKVAEMDKIPPGTILWSIPPIPGYHGKQIVQAVPTATGPDLYSIEENASGQSLIRALTSDGRQLWMKKTRAKIQSAVPH